MITRLATHFTSCVMHVQHRLAQIPLQAECQQDAKDLLSEKQPKRKLFLKFLDKVPASAAFARHDVHVKRGWMRDARRFAWVEKTPAPVKIIDKSKTKRKHRAGTLPMSLAQRTALVKNPNFLLADMAAAVLEPGQPMSAFIAMANGDGIFLTITYDAEKNQFLFDTENGSDEIVYVNNGKRLFGTRAQHLYISSGDQIILKNLTVLTVPEPALIRDLKNFEYGMFF
jgi:hypothetical protein